MEEWRRFELAVGLGLAMATRGDLLFSSALLLFEGETISLPRARALFWPGFGHRAAPSVG
jgi:hypothetical protein